GNCNLAYFDRAMLKKLYAKNIALIDEIEIGFSVGLNIITGETGAGKSILIGALGALLGEKMDRDIIRSGEDKGVIEGTFSLTANPHLVDFFNRNALDWMEDELLIRRELKSNGRGRCLINDSPVPLAVLRDMGDLLVDLHGQHEHQSLLVLARQFDFLDAFARLQDARRSVEASFRSLQALLRDLRQLRTREQEIRRSREALLFQQQEIDAIDPQSGEEEQLAQEERMAGHAEQLLESCRSLSLRLYEQDGSALEILASVARDLQRLAEIDASFADLGRDCDQARIIVDELARTVQSYAENLSFDPARLEEIRIRLSRLAGLKKKYGGTLQAVIDHRQKLHAELQRIENLDQELQELSDKLEKVRQQLGQDCSELSKQRQRAAEELSTAVAQKLNELGMPHTRFQVEIGMHQTDDEPFVAINGERIQVHSRGIDSVEFLISTNPGEELKPLVRVASGGEISRIMLALKSLLADSDRIPVLIFDEIDIGISGRIAQAVGQSLRRLAISHQVLCITHLPQIASMAHHHYLVEKSVTNGQTRTAVRLLNESERTEQVACLFGGEIVSNTHLQSARELIAEAQAMTGERD
ncbi:DNA repair protein RecN, partial [candidate division KSB1 bacterium]|nr:DNA repair protein RecN [candidate division KSB1 bacterium]